MGRNKLCKLADFVTIWNDKENYPTLEDVRKKLNFPAITSLQRFKYKHGKMFDLINRTEYKSKEGYTKEEVLEIIKDIKKYPTVEDVRKKLNYKTIESCRTIISTHTKLYGHEIPQRGKIKKDKCCSDFLELWNDKEVLNSEIMEKFGINKIEYLKVSCKDKIVLTRYFGESRFNMAVEKVQDMWNDKENYPTITSLKEALGKTHVTNFSSIIQHYKKKGFNFIDRKKKCEVCVP